MSPADSAVEYPFDHASVLAETAAISSRYTPAIRAYIAAARRLWHDDGRCEIDDDPLISPSDSGVYVQAWVWVASDDLLPEDGPSTSNSDTTL